MGNNILKFIFSRKAFMTIMILAQIVLFAILFIWLNEYFAYFYVFALIISLIIVIYLINKEENPSYKISWIVPILVFPIIGGFVYIFFNSQFGMKIFEKKIKRRKEDTKPHFSQKQEILTELEEHDKNIRNLVNYMNNYAGYPIYKNTSGKYLASGEEKFETLKIELENAKEFIFLEYFMIEPGEMWDTILDILIKKAKEGVDVRVMYDALGCLFMLPDKYYKKIEKYGIKCKAFNTFKPLLTSSQNNRDHRKILVIDGKTAFTGGINLTDEYINVKQPYGHWKDTSVMIKGEAVKSFTLMFLEMWELNEKEASDYFKYIKNNDNNLLSDGFVMPYGDNPIDREYVGEYVYMDIINKAKDYIYIMTPYLIVDNELMTSLIFAAKSGVDVKVIVPGIPDKKLVYNIGKSYFRELIENGIEVYSYTPGFVHAKNFVSDDVISVVGTINMDFRSLYLHFECACLFYKNKVVNEVKQDFLKTLAKCKKLSSDECKEKNIFKRIFIMIARIFAPLM